MNLHFAGEFYPEISFLALLAKLGFVQRRVLDLELGFVKIRDFVFCQWWSWILLSCVYEDLVLLVFW